MTARIMIAVLRNSVLYSSERWIKLFVNLSVIESDIFGMLKKGSELFLCSHMFLTTNIYQDPFTKCYVDKGCIGVLILSY